MCEKLEVSIVVEGIYDIGCGFVIYNRKFEKENDWKGLRVIWILLWYY